MNTEKTFQRCGRTTLILAVGVLLILAGFTATQILVNDDFNNSYNPSNNTVCVTRQAEEVCFNTSDLDNISQIENSSLDFKNQSR